MPSGRRANRRTRLFLRRCNGSFGRSSPPRAKNIKGVKLDLFVVLARMHPIEIGDAGNTKQHGLAIDDDEVERFFRAASTINGYQSWPLREHRRTRLPPRSTIRQ